jgi:hypothetical protein
VQLPSLARLSLPTICVALWSLGCGGSPSTPTPTPVDPASQLPVTSAPPPPSGGVPQLSPGTRSEGVIAANSPTCSYLVNDAVLTGPCRRYYIIGWHGRGKVNVTLSWSTGEELTLAIASGTGDMVPAGAACCQSPLQMTAPLFPLDATPVAVIYTGRTGLNANRTIPFVLSAGPFVPSP